MLQGIAEQVGDDLQQAVGVPRARGVAHRDDVELPTVLELGDRHLAQHRQITRARVHRQVSEPRGSEVEQLRDQAGHPSRRGPDRVCDAVQRRVLAGFQAQGLG